MLENPRKMDDEGVPHPISGNLHTSDYSTKKPCRPAEVST
jgi:hypothetical protein